MDNLALSFRSFFDLEEIQQIQDTFAYATGIATIITDPVGQAITIPSNFSDVYNILCLPAKGMKKNGYFSMEMIPYDPEMAELALCFIGGFLGASIKITVDGRHIANWLVGQIPTDGSQDGKILQHGKGLGIDVQKMQAALGMSPRMPVAQLKKICQVLFLTVNQLVKLATENAHKDSEIQRSMRTERLQAALYQISETASSSHSLAELYQAVHGIIATLISAKNIYIAIKDEEKGLLHFPYRVDEADGNTGSRKLTNGLAEYVIGLGQPLLVDPKLRDELEQRGLAITLGKRAMDWLGVPLKTADNKTFGVMAVFTFAERVRYSKEDQEILSFVSNQVAMAIQRKQAEQTLHYLGMHDVLTGLYNRAYFEKELIRFEEENFLPISIFMCDINGLKLVNDTFGHGVGDELLVAAAKLIHSVVRQGDLIARIGGDEFAVVLPKVDEKLAKSLARRIRSLVDKYKLESKGVPLSLSLGYGIKKTPTDSMEDILKEADHAMCREKLHHSQSGRSAIVQTVMKLLEERDFMTEEHAGRLEELTSKIACKLELPEARIADIQLLAQFHDIGKIGISDNILLKPGPLTVEEKKEMQRHSEIGYRIAQSHSDLAPIADWILKHHEWWNGKGYPFGLKGTEIPLECRILAIADAYDAMTSDRPYRSALGSEVAIEEIKRYAGIQFDPEIVAVFIEIF